MFPQFVFLSSLPSQYDQQVTSLTKSSRFEHSFKQSHGKELTDLNLDQRYIDSPIHSSATKNIDKLRQEILKYETFDTVVVAPLRKSLQTCFELFGNEHEKHESDKIQSKKVHFYIEPLLADRLNSTHSIGDISQAKDPKYYSRFSQFFQQFSQRTHKTQWLYDLIPQRVIKQLPNDIALTSSSQYVKLLKSTAKNNHPSQQNCLETQVQFIQRIHKLKDALLGYQHISGSGKKVLVIASAEVLNTLAATDFYESGEPVNPLRLRHGQHDLVNLVVNGFDIIRQLQTESILPFCR